MKFSTSLREVVPVKGAQTEKNTTNNQKLTWDISDVGGPESGPRWQCRYWSKRPFGHLAANGYIEPIDALC
jgi:hypothetical protein